MVVIRRKRQQSLRSRSLIIVGSSCCFIILLLRTLSVTWIQKFSSDLTSKEGTRARKSQTVTSLPRTVPHLDGINASVLVVGGSDGSGTRAVVDILGKLRVPMLIDDTQTYDVHASPKGWPTWVSKVLRSTHSLDYLPETLPNDISDDILRDLKELRQAYEVRADVLRLQAKHLPLARNITYGFKAPVSMILIPLLETSFKNIKFIHVVRDGRDVALSDNVSPVTKFYEDYHSASKPGHIGPFTINTTNERAMKLWNDWNLQSLFWWEKRQDKSSRRLLVRIEDLLGPNRLRTIQEISYFVGSSLSSEDLCCLSRRPVRDMGKSTPGKTVDTKAQQTKSPQKEFIARIKKQFLERKPDSSQLLTYPIAAKLEQERRLVDGGPPRVRKRIHHIHDNSDPIANLMNPRRRKVFTPGLDVGDTLLEYVNGPALREAANQSFVTNATASDVFARYGKWKLRSLADPHLIQELQAIGVEALRIFGYEPWKESIHEVHSEPTLCDVTIICPSSII